MAFDPDEYLAQTPPPAPPAAPQAFNPDAYLAGGGAPPETSDASAAVFARHAPQTLSGLITGQPTPDKYQQAAIAERDRLKAAGVRVPEGFTRRLASGPLLNWGDEIGAAMTTPFEMVRHGTLDPREGYAYGRARERLASNATADQTGILGDVVEGVGALATLPGNIIARQASAALGGGQAGIRGLAGRLTGYGAEGGLLGGVQGAGAAETMAEVPEKATWGGLLGAAFSAPFGAKADVARRSTAVTPSEAELKALGSKDYRARDRAPIAYSTERLADRLDAADQMLRTARGRDVPLTRDYIQRLSAEARADVARANALNPNAPGGVVPAGTPSGAANSWQAVTNPRDIASLRREIYEAGAKGSPTDEQAGVIASKLIDRVLTRPNAADLARGDIRDAIAAAQLDKRGRGNFSAGYRSEAVTDAVNKSLEQAAGQHSGLNFENIIRQNLRQAKAKEAFQGFNPAEEAGVDKLIAGTAKANSLREFGNMLGGGGGLGRMAAMGGGGAGGGALASYYYGGDPWMGALGGLALGTTGRALRTYGNYKARTGTEAFAEELRRRSPEYASRVAVAPTEIGPGLPGPISRGAKTALTVGGGGDLRDAIAKGLLYQTTGQRELPRIYVNEPDEEKK